MTSPDPVIERLIERMRSQSEGCQIVHRLVQKLRIRSEIGVRKYGTTLARIDLTRDDWLRHGIEEALDLAAYLEAVSFHDGTPVSDLQDKALEIASTLQALLLT